MAFRWWSRYLCCSVTSRACCLQIAKAMLMNDLHADLDETRDSLEDVLQHSVDAEGLAETVSSYAADCRRVVWADDRLAVVDTSLDGSIEAAMRRCVACKARLPLSAQHGLRSRSCLHLGAHMGQAK